MGSWLLVWVGFVLMVVVFDLIWVVVCALVVLVLGGFLLVLL